MISLIPVEGMPEVAGGDEMADLVLAAADLEDYDVVVVTQKVVSKAEGRLVPVGRRPSMDARRQLILSESVRVLRDRDGLVISETRHGFVCANAGVDLSNVAEGQAALLPVDPDRSARHIRDAIRARTGLDGRGHHFRHFRPGVAQRPHRRGHRLRRHRRRRRPPGHHRHHRGSLTVTEVCVVDEMAGAAELAKGKSTGIPAVIVRGADHGWFRESSVKGEVVRPYGQDLFR